MRSAARRFFDLGLAVTVVLWGFNFIALKIAYRQMAVPVMSLTRFLMTWAALALVCTARGESLRFPKDDLYRLLALGFLSNGVYMVLFLEGIARTGAAEGAILVNAAPIFAILIAAATGTERAGFARLGGAFVALIGVAIVGLGGNPKVGGSLLGNGLVLASAVVWAWSVVLTRPLVKRYSPLRVLTLSMAGAAFVIVPYGLRATLEAPWGSFSPATLLATCHVGLLSGAVGFTLFFTGIRKVGPTGAVLYQYAVPVLAAVFAWLMLNDPLAWPQILGMGVVFGGLAAASAGGEPEPDRALPCSE